MATNDSAALQTAAHESTDPRPNHIPLGVDAQGASHVYDTVTETVHIVHEDGSRGRRCLGDHSVEDWMDAVGDAQGWASKRYGVPLADRITTNPAPEGED
jgi:hypothetical protein